ncbi:hypothetical protein [Xenorhabdus bakwenae]|uniref:hypothetical protein n=1 Tax=Xenorhabdus bakwenae TaxID=3026967 RepID=UPI0025581A0A|nr:hypothetical protein [Xenorhabdus sp. SF857]
MKYSGFIAFVRHINQPLGFSQQLEIKMPPRDVMTWACWWYAVQVILTTDIHNVDILTIKVRSLMNFNTKVRIFTLIYLAIACALALPVIVFISDMIMGGVVIDLIKKEYTFYEFILFRWWLYTKLAAIGAVLGFVFWFIEYRKYRYHDELDKYFKR